MVTPLRPGEYLTSKVSTLTALSLAENVVLVSATWGLGFAAPAWILGIVLASVLFCLAGFLAVVRYDSINEYLMPPFVYITVLSLPILPYFGLVESRLFDLHPFQAPRVLFRHALAAGESAPTASAVLASVLWVRRRRALPARLPSLRRAARGGAPAMTLLGAVRALGPIDLKSVWRDPMLRWLALLPLALALVLRWFVPPLLEKAFAVDRSRPERRFGAARELYRLDAGAEHRRSGDRVPAPRPP